MLQVARKPDGTESSKDEREAPGFDDYVIFDVDVQDVPVRLEDRRRIQWARTAASESRDLMTQGRARSKQAVLDLIAKWKHFTRAAEYVSGWRSHLEAACRSSRMVRAESRCIPEFQGAADFGRNIRFGEYTSDSWVGA